MLSIIGGGYQKNFQFGFGKQILYICIHTHTHTHTHTPGRRPVKFVKFCHWEQVTWTCLVTVRLKYIHIYLYIICIHKYTDTHTQLAITKGQ